MINSMTGFGRNRYEDEKCRIQVQLKTVNNRYLDLHIHLDPHYSFLEPSLRKWVQSRISRGRVEMNVDIFAETEDQHYCLNVPALQGLYQQAEKLDFIQDLNLSAQASLPAAKTLLLSQALLTVPGIVRSQLPELDEKAWEEPVKEAVDEALTQLEISRAREGEFLKEDLLGKLDQMEALTHRIKQRAPERVQEHMEKLKAGIAVLLEDSSAVDATVLANELLLYAQKVDVDEEMTRMESHIQAFRLALDQGSPIGKKLDFISQEMNREANTTASKSNDAECSQVCIEMKTIIEEIREQVQNIE